MTRYGWAMVRFATSWNSGRSRNDHDVSPAAAATPLAAPNNCPSGALI